jgi:hypothetical protein
MFFAIAMMFNHLAHLSCFKDWIRVGNKVKARKLSTLIKLFLVSSSAIEIIGMSQALHLKLPKCVLFSCFGSKMWQTTNVEINIMHID